MAIQNRRGVFSEFDPAKMLPGEIAVVLTGDTSTEDGKSIYVCFAPGDVKQLATSEDLTELVMQKIVDTKTDVVDELANSIGAELKTAIEASEKATKAATTATASANSATSSANTQATLASTAYVNASNAALRANNAAEEAREAINRILSTEIVKAIDEQTALDAIADIFKEAEGE